MAQMSSLRRSGIKSVSTGAVGLLLIGVLACPMMLVGIGERAAACSESGDSHAPMSDTWMSCCESTAARPRLAPSDAYSSHVLKNSTVALLTAAVTVAPPCQRAVRPVVSSAATTTTGPPVYLQNGSFLI